MRVFVFGMVLLLFCSTLVVALELDMGRTPSWLLDSKRVSMHHSVSFSYGTFSRSYQSLYANSIQYILSPEVTLSGTFGYYQHGGKYKSYKSMLHGFGITYRPGDHFQIHLEYRGVSPISKPGSSGELNFLKER